MKRCTRMVDTIGYECARNKINKKKKKSILKPIKNQENALKMREIAKRSIRVLFIAKNEFLTCPGEIDAYLRRSKSQPPIIRPEM